MLAEAEPSVLLRHIERIDERVEDYVDRLEEQSQRN